MMNRKTVALILAGTLLAIGCARKQQVVQPAPTTQLAAPATTAVQPQQASATKRYQAPYSK